MKIKKLFASALAATVVFGSTAAYAEPIDDVVIIGNVEVDRTRDFVFAPGSEPEEDINASELVTFDIKAEYDESDDWTYFIVTYNVVDEYKDIYDVYIKGAHASAANWGVPMEDGSFKFTSISGKGSWVGLYGVLYLKGTEYYPTNVAAKDFTFAEGSEPTDKIDANDCVVVTFDSDKAEYWKNVRVTVALADEYKDKYELEVSEVIGSNISEVGYPEEDGVTYTVPNRGYYLGDEHVITVSGTLTAKEAADDPDNTPETPDSSDDTTTPAAPGDTETDTPETGDGNTRPRDPVIVPPPSTENSGTTSDPEQDIEGGAEVTPGTDTTVKTDAGDITVTTDKDDTALENTTFVVDTVTDTDNVFEDVLGDYPTDSTKEMVAEAEKAVADGYAVILDLSFEKDNVKVQPDKSVTITLPVPAELKGAGKIFVYHASKGSITFVAAPDVIDGKITFTADKFSPYIFSKVELKTVGGSSVDASNPGDGSNPNTGIGYAFIPAMIAAGAVIASFKKRK